MTCPRLAQHIAALHRWSRHVTPGDIDRATIDHHILGCPACHGWAPDVCQARHPDDDPKDTA